MGDLAFKKNNNNEEIKWFSSNSFKHFAETLKVFMQMLEKFQ